MSSQSVDLVYELQGELNWDKEFASSACKEYSRWLQLRAKTGDFQSCRLPPSRVVAMVWNLHRQWTMDYEKTCASLGGFIHHYPPAMRMSFSREQGYAVTLQTYKSHFKEDPPVAYWEPPICPSRPNVGPPGLLTQTTGSVLQSSATERDEDAPRRDLANAAAQKGGGFSRPRRRSASHSRRIPSNLDGKGLDQAEEGSAYVPSDRVTFEALTEPLSLDQGVMLNSAVDSSQRADGQRKENSREESEKNLDVALHALLTVKDVDEKEAKLKRSHKGGRKIQEGFVLRPLAPGEKRRRGRPSLSEYIPISELADDQENGEETGLISEEKDNAGKSNGDSSTPRSKSAPISSAKGRKGGSSKPQVQIIAPRPSREANGNRPESSRSLKQGPPLTKGTRGTATGRDEHKSAAAISKQQAAGSVRTGSDRNPLRRPRGRPRKDGSWPIPRAKRQQMAQAALARPSQQEELLVSQAEEAVAGKQEGYLSTTLVPDTSIDQADVPMPNLETDVGSQMLDTTAPDSNGAQLQGAVPEREHETVL